MKSHSCCGCLTGMRVSWGVNKTLMLHPWHLSGVPLDRQQIRCLTRHTHNTNGSCRQAKLLRPHISCSCAAWTPPNIQHQTSIKHPAPSIQQLNPGAAVPAVQVHTSPALLLPLHSKASPLFQACTFMPGCRHDVLRAPHTLPHALVTTAGPAAQVRAPLQ